MIESMTVILQDILYKVKCEKITNLGTISKPPRDAILFRRLFNTPILSHLLSVSNKFCNFAVADRIAEARSRAMREGQQT